VNRTRTLMGERSGINWNEDFISCDDESWSRRAADARSRRRSWRLMAEPRPVRRRDIDMGCGSRIWRMEQRGDSEAFAHSAISGVRIEPESAEW